MTKNDENMQLSMQIGGPRKSPQNLLAVGLENVSLIEPLSRFDPYGVWRLDIISGLVYWSDDVFAIHGMDVVEGPVDVLTAVNAYHPDDRSTVMQCVEEAVAKKSGYRFVLRIVLGFGEVKLVKSTGVYRETKNGPELYGTFSEFQAPVRTVSFD